MPYSSSKYQMDPSSQGYDNRAYAGSQQPSGGRNYAEDPHGYRGSSRAQKETNRRCIVIVAIIAFLILIAAAIAIGVYFGVTKDDDKDRRETAAATVPMSLSFDETWNDAYYDPNSQAYKDKAAEVESVVDDLMTDVPEYISNDVTGLFESSVGATVILKLRATKITKDDGNQVDVNQANMKQFVNEKAAAKAGTNAFAARLMPAKTSASPIVAGDVGNVDLGGTCSSVTDCSDNNVACPDTTKKCTCKSGYFNRNANSNNGGVCLQGKAINATCPTGLDRECTFTSGKCVNNKCRCDSGKVWKNGACTDIVDVCMAVVWENQDCSSLVELFTIRDKLDTQNDICVSAMLMKTEFLPACFDRHQARDCMTIVDTVWTKMVMAKESGYPTVSLSKIFIDDCANVETNICQSQTIATVFRCYNRYNEGGRDCSVNHCLLYPANDDGCSGTIDVTPILTKAVSIYGGTPDCPFGPCASNGHSYFSDMNVCGAALAAYDTNSQCIAFESYIGCVSFNLVAQGLDKCDSKTLVDNLNADAGDQAGTICSTGYADLDIRIPATKSEMCDAVFVHRSIYLYYCPASPNMFTGSSTRDQCLKEVSQKVCLYTAFEQAGIKCDDAVIWETSELPEVISGIFTQTNCEDAEEYSCVMTGLALSPYLAPTCVNGIMQFLELSGKGVNIDTDLALNAKSDSDYLKCRIVADTLIYGTSLANRVDTDETAPTGAASSGSTLFANTSNHVIMRVLDQMTGCAHGVLLNVPDTPCTDKAGLAGITTALLIMANAGSANSPGATKKVDIFEECPAYEPSTSPCPTTEAVMNSVMGHCGNHVVQAKQDGEDSQKVCDMFGECAQGVMAGFTEAYKTICDKLEMIYEPLSSIKYLQYYKDTLGVDCGIFDGCLAAVWTNEDCSSLVGLFSITEQLDTQNDKCVSSDLAVKEFLPSCFDRHKVPECKPLASSIWTRMVQEREGDNSSVSLTSMFLDSCENFQTDICQSQTIATLFRCFNRYNEGASACNVNHCVEYPSNNDNCTVSIDINAVKTKAQAIYGGVPACQYKPCAEGGFTYFSDPSVCGAALIEYEATGKTDCSAFESFIGCVSFNLVAQGLDKCDSKTLVDNLKADAGDRTGTICATGYEDLDSRIPATKDEMCDAVFVHRSIYQFYCPASPNMFTGSSARDQCLSEVGQKVCLYTLFEQSGIKCDDAVVWATSELSAVTSGGVFDHTNCEDDYGCVNLGLGLSDYLVPSCVNGIMQFLELSGKGIPIDTALAKGAASNSADYLKCRVLHQMTSCAYGVLLTVPDTPCVDQDGLADITTALLIMANAGSANSPGAVQKVDIFEGCPEFVPSTSLCPAVDDVLYAVMGYCANHALNAKNELQSNVKVCDGLGECAEGVMHGFIGAYKTICSDVERIVGQVGAREYLEYIKNTIGVDCHEKVGECPEVPDDQAGICVEECGKDDECDGAQKCCFNGCGHTCVDPVIEWPRCGEESLAMAKSSCAPMFTAWLAPDGTCSDWEAFVGCVHFQYLAAGVDICGFTTFANNLKQQVMQENPGKTPALCPTSDFESKLPTTKAGICTNPLVYNTILKYICVENESTAVFDGADTKRACQREITRLICVGTIFGDSNLDCGTDAITATKNMAAARAGVFSNDARCEETYPCLMEPVIKMLEMDNQAAQCILGVIGFLDLSTFNVDINTAPALGSNNLLMKCGVLDAMAYCAQDSHSDGCKTQLSDVRAGLLLMANMYQTSLGLSSGVARVDVFDNCPAPIAADFPSHRCPVNNMFVKMVIGQCTSGALRALASSKDDGNSDNVAMEGACNTMLYCAGLVRDGWRPSCQTIDDHYNMLFEASTLAWLKQNTRLDCPDPRIQDD